MPYCRGIAFGLLLELLPAQAQAQSLPVFEGAGVDADALMFHREETEFFESNFMEWQNLGTVRLAGEAKWSPTLNKRGAETATLRSYQESQSLYMALGPQADVKLSRVNEDFTFNYRDSANYSAQLHSAKRDFPMAVLYHLLPADSLTSSLDLLLDFKAFDHLEYSLGFKWRRPEHSVGSHLYSLECLHTFRDTDDPFTFEDLRPLGSGEKVSGSYASRYQSLSALTEIELGPGIWAAGAVYKWSLPRLPKSEYGFTDSSQSLRLGLQFKGTRRLPSLGYAYSEGRTRTSGLRVPTGSEGGKRFHYALTSHTLQEMRLKSANHTFLPHSSTSLGMAGSYYTLQSSPPVNAIDQHKETLSYNRLGLSFIADVYGGFSRSGELIQLDGRLGQIELSPRHEQRFSSLCLSAEVPVVLTWLDLSLHGETKTQGPFTTHIDRVYTFRREGQILSLTPRLAAEWKITTWKMGQLKLGGKVSQMLLLWNDVKDASATPADPVHDSAKVSDYPPLANGFLGEVSMTLDY